MGLSFHNSLVDVIDPLGATEKVFGNNDPLNLYGGITKANEEEQAKAVAEADEKVKTERDTTFYNRYGITVDERK